MKYTFSLDYWTSSNKVAPVIPWIEDKLVEYWISDDRSSPQINLFSFGNAIAGSFASSFSKSVAVGTGVANANSTAISSGNAILEASGTADANSSSLGNGRKAVFIISPLNCWISGDRITPAFVEFWSLINGSTNSSKLDYWVSIIQISPDFLAFKIIVGKNVVLCIIEGF